MILLIALLSCSPTDVKISTPEKANYSILEVDVDTLYAKKQKNENLVIVDVRTPTEYSAGHIPDAKPIPLNELSSSLSQLKAYKDQEIYLVCAVGGRSQQATNWLREKGFSKAINVQGGTRGWKAKGYPLQ